MKQIRIFKISSAATITACAFFATVWVQAQQTTERYIPIGQSPGISEKYSFIGEIVATDASAHTIVIDSNRGRRTVEVTPTTKIWMDRSNSRQSNSVASYEDCKVGYRVEVMHLRNDESIADWIKIEVQ